MNKDKVDYILNHFSKLMSKREAEAWRHWSTNYKNILSNSTENQKEIRTRLMIKNGWLSQDKETLKLLQDGIEKFRENTANRIFSENPEVLDFNYCPKCNKLARTPFAKQCRYCRHDWH